MKLSAISVLAISICSQLVSATPLDMSAKRHDSSTTGLKWTGPIFPGDDHDAYSFYGDARDIYKQIIATNPSYKATDFANATDMKRDVLQRRNAITPVNCNLPNSVELGSPGAYNDGINYLISIGGACSVGAGPRTCVRMTCNSDDGVTDAGIFLCNDNPSPISPQCAYLAGYVNEIYHECSGAPSVNYKGQQFDTDKYNVVAAGTDCSVSPHQNPF